MPPIFFFNDEQTLATLPVVTRLILVEGLIAKRYYTSPSAWDGQLGASCMIKIGNGSPCFHNLIFRAYQRIRIISICHGISPAEVRTAHASNSSRAGRIAYGGPGAMGFICLPLVK